MSSMSAEKRQLEESCNQWKTVVCLHDLPSLSPKLRYFARPGPPFVIRSVLIGWGCPDYKWWTCASEKTDFGGEREEIVKTQNIFFRKWPLIQKVASYKRFRVHFSLNTHFFLRLGDAAFCVLGYILNLNQWDSVSFTQTTETLTDSNLDLCTDVTKFIVTWANLS